MQQAISYRDRDGFVIIKDHIVERYVRNSYARDYDHLMQSGLYQHLVGEGLLIPHKERNIAGNEIPDIYKILEPEKINFISFPYEWSACQWKQMMLAFLQINKICLDYGMILKDATPFNFTFHKGSCVFFDTLSFELYDDQKPWIAYRQFCETMLGPLALLYFNNTLWTRMMPGFINGWPLPFISSNLPFKTWISPAILIHIHWHARVQKEKKGPVKSDGLSKEKLQILWKMIQHSVSRWAYPYKQENWLHYYHTDIQSEEYLQNKTKTITQWLEELRPVRVIDLGANTGMFSIIASRYAEEVIAVESDHACMTQLRQYINLQKIENIHTVIADLAQPVPGAGWRNKEKAPLLERLKADMVFALALIHHLCITANIPLSFVADLFAEITTRYIVVEFIPRSDKKVREMLQNRKDIFDDYTEEEFNRCFSKRFILRNYSENNFSDRKLYVWEKK